MISVIVPTVRGREALLKRTLAVYETVTDHGLEIVVARDKPTCGEAWNAGVEQASGDWIVLGADDLVPDAGWDAAAVEAATLGVYPAPRILSADGSTLCCGSLGSGLLLGEDARDGLPVCSSPIPFMRREAWERIGPSLPIHYYSDDWLGYRARLAGLRPELRRGYCFTHLDGKVGNSRVVARAMADRAKYAEAVTAC